ncbi:MAG: hypothetical protein QM831_34950 [Kofleriaceae bacterium]
MRAALLAIALVGCSTDKGVAVFVHPSSGDVMYVRLFMGTGSSTQANLTNDSKVTADRANYWVRAPNNDQDLLQISAGTDAKFAFLTDDAIPVVIAVGYDKNKSPIEAGYLTDIQRKDGDDVSAYELDLATANAFGAGGMEIGVWSPPSPNGTPLIDAACAGVIDPTADHPLFVVREEDQDCDGNADGSADECTPDDYLSSAPPDSDKATCLVPSLTPASCRFGGKYCTDLNATPPQNGSDCNPSTVCTPTAVCATCENDPDPAGCAKDINRSHTIAGNTLGRYICSIEVDPSTNRSCKTSIRLPLPPTGGYNCTNVRIGDADHIGDSLPAGNDKLTLMDDHCGAVVDVPEDVALVSGKDITGYVQWDLENNASIAMPIDFQVTLASSVCPAETTTDCVRYTEQPGDSDTQRCAAAWTPHAVTTFLTNGATSQIEPTLSHDLTELVYHDDLAKTLRYAKRANAGVPFGAEVVVMAASGDDYNHPEISDDGQNLLVVSALGVSIASRNATMTGQFGTPSLLVQNGADSAITSATFEPDGSLIVTIEPALNPMNLSHMFHITFAATNIMTMDMVDTGGLDSVHDPHESPDGLHLYFSAVEIQGTAETLYVMSRGSVDDPWSTPVALTEMGDPTVSSPWVSADGQYMVYVVSSHLTVAKRADL